MTKTLTLCAVALMCTTGIALTADNPSGRPGKILNDQQCQKAWQAAGAKSGSLSEAKATPYVLNFPMVDKSKDRKISSDEWQAGCKAGWISADASKVTAKDDPVGGTNSGADQNSNAADLNKSGNSSNMMDENQSQ